MRIGTVEEYVKASFLSTAEALQDTLAEPGFQDQFPFSVIVEGDYPEWDMAERWCWQSFGPRNGECDWTTAYPACPIILAAEKILETRENGGYPYSYMTYANPIKHSHLGTWTTYWFGKTDYDHGFGAFCFSNESDRMRFMAHVPEVDLADEYFTEKCSE